MKQRTFKDQDPMTFTRHHLSPLAGFTSGAYFSHNGRRWQCTGEVYSTGYNPFTVMLAAPSPGKRPVKIPNLKSLRLFPHFAGARERTYINNYNNNNILYSSQWEIKAVVRSHNEEHISVILSHETHAHTHS